MNTLFIVSIILSIISFIIIIFISSHQNTNRCKLQRFCIYIYSIILELVWVIIFNIILCTQSYSILVLLFAALLSLTLVNIFNEILNNITFQYFYMNQIYKVSLIIMLEILTLRIYPYYKRIKRLINRITKKLIQLIPIILIELIFIYIFSIFINIQDKEWEIFELIFTTVIITAYINIYNSEKDRRNNLKWQYKYSYFVESNMYDYIERILILIGMHSKYDYKIMGYLSQPSIVINEINVYYNSLDYKKFLIENDNNAQKFQKYIEDITETFIYNLKEQRNEIIHIKQNKNNEDYLYHNCIEDANKLKIEILLSDINEIGKIIQKRLPSLIQNCSDILSLVNSIWNEDDKYSKRIMSILEETKYN